MLLPLWWDMSSPCLEGMISDEQKLVDSLIAPWNLPIYHLKILMLGQINIIWKSMVENLLMKMCPFYSSRDIPIRQLSLRSSTVSRSPGKKVAEVEGVLGVHMACSNEWNSFSGSLDVKRFEESLKQKHVWCFCWGRGEMDGWSLRKMVIIYKYDGVEWLMFGPHKLICLRIFVGDEWVFSELISRCFCWCREGGSRRSPWAVGYGGVAGCLFVFGSASQENHVKVRPVLGGFFRDTPWK